MEEVHANTANKLLCFLSSVLNALHKKMQDVKESTIFTIENIGTKAEIAFRVAEEAKTIDLLPEVFVSQFEIGKHH